MRKLVLKACLALTVLLVSSLPGCATLGAKEATGKDVTDKWLEKRDPHRPRLYSYRVKYLCSFLHPLPTVFHWTDVNVLNPSKQETAAVTKKFIVSGKQKQPPPVPPRRDAFRLGPNQSIHIDCDEIQAMLGKPLSTPMDGFVEIESATELTVVGVYDKCVPQPRTDVFPHSVVTGLISIRGLVDKQPFRVTGPVVVKKGEPRILPDLGRFVQPTEMESMDLRGVVDTSQGPLEVQIFESPEVQSAGQISGRVDPQTLAAQPPYDSYFDVNAMLRFQPPKGPSRDLQILDARVTAVLTSIPPGPPIVEDDGTTRPREEDEYFKPETPLRDPVTGKVVGTLQELRHQPVGPPPNGGGNGKPSRHSPVACDNSSIDVEYVEPAMVWEKEEKRYEGKANYPPK
jgi:hypothetical protein